MYPNGNDGLWLDGHTIANKDKTERFLAIKFGQQSALLAKHLRVFCKRGSTPEEFFFVFLLNSPGLGEDPFGRVVGGSSLLFLVTRSINYSCLY